MLNFIGNGQGKILNLFFQDVSKEYYLNEIAEILGVKGGEIKHHLDVLTKQHILLDRRRGNMRFFKLNRNHSLYNEIKNIISKTIGIQSKLLKIINKVNGIKTAFIFGSVAKDRESLNSDIDLLLIGDNINQDIILDKVNKYERELNRKINYQAYSTEEFARKIKKRNPFIINILNEPILLLKGNIDEYKREIRWFSQHK